MDRIGFKRRRVLHVFTEMPPSFGLALYDLAMQSADNKTTVRVLTTVSSACIYTKNAPFIAYRLIGKSLIKSHEYKTRFCANLVTGRLV